MQPLSKLQVLPVGALSVETILKPSDVEFLSKHRLWLQSLLEYALLKDPPSPNDLVFIKTLPKPTIYIEQGFVALKDLVKQCEDAARNSMIYEVWLADALLNAYQVARCLSDDDGERFIQFFKAYHGVEGEGRLAREAVIAVADARRDLYGDEFI